jgi:hypothetical protein
MLSGVSWYVAVRFVALGVFVATDVMLWQRAVTSPPSHRRVQVAAALWGLVLVVGTVLAILFP